MGNIPQSDDNSSSEHKRCSHCDTVQPLDAFGSCKRTKDGRHSWCKTCARAYGREYYAADADRVGQWMREHGMSRVDASRAVRRLRYIPTREKIREQQRERRQKQSEQRAAEYEAARARQKAERAAAKQRVSCQGCGQVYVPRPGNRGRFCSRACLRRRSQKTCEQCGVLFEIPIHQETTARFCSWACRRAYTPRVSIACEQCGTIFERPPAGAERARFCSRSCASIWRMEHHVITPGYIGQKRQTGYRTDIEAMAEAILIELGLEYRFEHKIGRYSADYAFPQWMVVLECDGIHHLKEDRPEKDKLRDAALAAKGWTVLRVADADLRADARAAVLAVLAPYLG